MCTPTAVTAAIQENTLFALTKHARDVIEREFIYEPSQVRENGTLFVDRDCNELMIRGLVLHHLCIDG